MHSWTTFLLTKIRPWVFVGKLSPSCEWNVLFYVLASCVLFSTSWLVSFWYVAFTKYTIFLMCPPWQSFVVESYFASTWRWCQTLPSSLLSLHGCHSVEVLWNQAEICLLHFALWKVKSTRTLVISCSESYYISLYPFSCSRLPVSNV